MSTELQELKTEETPPPQKKKLQTSLSTVRKRKNWIDSDFTIMLILPFCLAKAGICVDTHTHLYNNDDEKYYFMPVHKD